MRIGAGASVGTGAAWRGREGMAELRHLEAPAGCHEPWRPTSGGGTVPGGGSGGAGRTGTPR